MGYQAHLGWTAGAWAWKGSTAQVTPATCGTRTGSRQNEWKASAVEDNSLDPSCVGLSTLKAQERAQAGAEASVSW